MNKLDLNTIIKMAVIALILAGIYYFVSAAQFKGVERKNQNSSNTNDEFLMKQKCNDAGSAYVKRQEDSGLSSVNSLFEYNRSLNTCLVYLEGTQSSQNRDQVLVTGNIFNVFTNSIILHQACLESISKQTYIYCQRDNTFFLNKANELMGKSVCGGLFDLCEVGKDVPIRKDF